MAVLTPPDRDVLLQFERGLDTVHPERSSIPARIIGYGEISAIFSIEGVEGWVFKRLPIFDSVPQAERYVARYRMYTGYLHEAGIRTPHEHTYILPGSPVVLYIAQEYLEPETFAHRLIHHVPPEDGTAIIRTILLEIMKVWRFNRVHAPEVELSIDGQLSNWARRESNWLYVDTSTPVFRLQGREQIDPEPFLRSVPAPFRWIIRRFFLPQVLERYYNLRLVYVDLIANLYKEKKPDLIEPAIEVANSLLPDSFAPITRREVDAYYRQDRFIWEFFLRARYIDRRVHQLLHRPYPFLLPGRIER